MDQKLTNRNKWCYSIGGLRDVEYQIVTMFLLVYIQYTVPLTNAQFAAIGVIMTLCKIWDAINDPMMGTIIENANLKGGKFRPWILIGALSSGLVTALMFTVRISNGWGYVAFIGVAYLLWGMTFTINDVSFWSMLPALSNNPSERDMLTTLMGVFCSVGAFAVAAVVPMVTTTDKVVRYAVCALICVVIFVSAQLLTFFGVTEKPRDLSKKAEKITLKKMFGIIRNNDQLLWITLALCCYYLGSGLLLQFGVNFCNFEYGYAKGGSVYTVFAVVYLAATLVSQLLYPKLASKISRGKLLSIGVWVSVAGYALLMAFGYVLPKSIAVIVASGTLIFGGQNWINLVVIVQMSNTIEYNELRTGNRDESIVFSLRSFLAKLTGAIQTVIVSCVLLTSGIKGATDTIASLEDSLSRDLITAEQVTAEAEKVIAATPDSARLILRFFMVAIPIVLLIICNRVDRTKYTITEDRYNEIIAELESRKA